MCIFVGYKLYELKDINSANLRREEIFKMTSVKIQSRMFLQYMVHTGQRPDAVQTVSHRVVFQNRLCHTRSLEQ